MAGALTVRERAARLVATRPRAASGQGGHATTFGVACVLVHGFGMSPEEAMPVMMEYNASLSEQWSERELWHKLRSALSVQDSKPRGYLLEGKVAEMGAAAVYVPPVKKTKAAFSLERLEAVQVPDLPRLMTEWRAWLAERSTVPPETVTPEAYLDALFRAGEKVLIFENMRTRGDYGREIGKKTWKLGSTPERAPVVAPLPSGTPEGMTFLMQPVDGRWYMKNDSAEMTRRGKRSVTRWPYILLESDAAPPEKWLNALVRARLRIVSITSSGGRSLHAVVRLDMETEEDLRLQIDDPNAREVLVVLGCDSQALHTFASPRLPNTTRGGKVRGKRGPDGEIVRDGRGRAIMEFAPFASGPVMQSLLYFNPEPVRGKSIREGAFI